jgi:hypothetical protein
VQMQELELVVFEVVAAAFLFVEVLVQEQVF